MLWFLLAEIPAITMVSGGSFHVLDPNALKVLVRVDNSAEGALWLALVRRWDRRVGRGLLEGTAVDRGRIGVLMSDLAAQSVIPRDRFYQARPVEPSFSG